MGYPAEAEPYSNFGNGGTISEVATAKPDPSCHGHLPHGEDPSLFYNKMVEFIKSRGLNPDNEQEFIRDRCAKMETVYYKNKKRNPHGQWSDPEKFWNDSMKLDKWVTNELDKHIKKYQPPPSTTRRPTSAEVVLGQEMKSLQ